MDPNTEISRLMFYVLRSLLGALKPKTGFCLGCLKVQEIQMNLEKTRTGLLKSNRLHFLQHFKVLLKDKATEITHVL